MGEVLKDEKTIKLYNAYPITISSLELSNSSENTTLRVSITLAYEDWEAVGTVDGLTNLAGRAGDLISNSVNLVRNIGKITRIIGTFVSHVKGQHSNLARRATQGYAVQLRRATLRSAELR